MDKGKILLMIGSPRKDKSTSYSIGKYLLDNLMKCDYTNKTVYVYDCINNEKYSEEMYQLFNDSDLIIFSYPLYVDSIPAPCIKVLEYITEKRQDMKCQTKKAFLAIGNCGFYEKEQIQNSLNVCKFFAKENNLNWYGGISIGGGPQIGGKDLKKLGGMTKKLREGLDIVADSIAYKRPIPMEEVNKLTSPPEGKNIYFLMANLGFKLQAKRNGLLKNINDTPYKE